MATFIALEPGGLLDLDHVVAAGHARSAPIVRMLRTTEPSRVMNLTYGFPRQSIVLLDTGHIAILPLSLSDIRQYLQGDPHDR